MTLPIPKIPQSSFSTLAGLELDSIAAGVETVDAILKEAPVIVLVAQPSSSGKYLVLFTGEVDEAVRSLGRGIERARDTVVDDVLLPAAAPGLLRALSLTPPPSGLTDRARPLPAVGVIETTAAPTLLGAADTAVKTGETEIEEVHLLAGIGGKSTVLIYGDVESVRVAVEAGATFAASRSRLVRRVVIPRPDPGILPFIVRGRGS